MMVWSIGMAIEKALFAALVNYRCGQYTWALKKKKICYTLRQRPLANNNIHEGRGHCYHSKSTVTSRVPVIQSY